MMESAIDDRYEAIDTAGEEMKAVQANITILATGGQLKGAHMRTFKTAHAALEEIGFLNPNCGSIQILSDEGRELTVGELKMLAQEERRDG